MKERVPNSDSTDGFNVPLLGILVISILVFFHSDCVFTIHIYYTVFHHSHGVKIRYR